jgi:uncharacterized protein YbjT (DUF2867 family)
MTRIAVAGGTGVVGRHVVARLQQDGHEPVVLTRSNGVDITTASGLADALDGVRVLIDVANIQTLSKRSAVRFFHRAAENLARAEREAGVAHHVVLSIVGIDDVNYGYYAGKRMQEAAVKAAGVPWTVLRATQFHEFPVQLVERMKGPVVAVPATPSQPIAAQEVADVLVDLAAGPPRCATLSASGPEVHQLPDLVRRVLRAGGSRRLVVPIPMPRSMGSGDALLDPSPDFRGTHTFREWLEQRE